MGRETIGLLEEPCPSEGDTLAARLANLERAYATLLERVRGYERERSEIKRRLERILSRIGTLDGAA